MSSNSSSPKWPNTIHFNESYMAYQNHFNGFAQICAIVPWIYILPSFHIICKIFAVYLTSNWARPEPGLNQHVFLVISLSQLTVFVFFLFDYFTINSILLRVGVPLTWIYPIFFTFFLIPAVGVCRQISSPYPFGSVHIYYANPAFGLRNSPLYLGNTLAWMTLSIMANILLFWKVAKARAQLITFQRSGVSYKAELSLSITTVTMILFYVINGTFIIMYILYYGKAAYFTHLVTLKSFANDLQTCVVPWIFYLTHPVFRKKTITSSDIFVSTSSFKRRVING
ncbi:unnamed protein product [Caenorhabditis nigoni]